jgi:hypothetical protein
VFCTPGADGSPVSNCAKGGCLLHGAPPGRGLRAFCTTRAWSILYDEGLEHSVRRGPGAFCTTRAWSILYDESWSILYDGGLECFVPRLTRVAWVRGFAGNFPHRAIVDWRMAR